MHCVILGAYEVRAKTILQIYIEEDLRLYLYLDNFVRDQIIIATLYEYRTRPIGDRTSKRRTKILQERSKCNKIIIL